MAEVIDARGLSCPMPVVMVKKKLGDIDRGSFDVIVDSSISAENVASFATSVDCEATIVEREEAFTVHIEKKARREEMSGKTGRQVVVFIPSNTIGRGDDELGAILMRSFLPTLLEIESRPKKMIFMNSGVKLTAAGSPVVEILRKIEEKGSELLICGTCLDYFGLKDQIRVGRVSNMFEIVETLLKADIVVNM